MENDEIVVEETTEEEVPQEEEVVEEDALEETEEAEEESTEDEVDWKSEALKYKAIALRNKKKTKDVKSNINSKLQDKAESPDVEVVSRLANLEMAEKKRQFGYEHGLSPKETDAVFKIDSDPSVETLKDPFIKAGLEALKSQERVAKNTPTTSAKSQRIDTKKMKDLSPVEQDRELQKFLKSKGAIEG